MAKLVGAWIVKCPLLNLYNTSIHPVDSRVKSTIPRLVHMIYFVYGPSP